jgi:hypothetical protein
MALLPFSHHFLMVVVFIFIIIVQKVVIDEASMVTEPAMLVPITHG